MRRNACAVVGRRAQFDLHMAMGMDGKLHAVQVHSLVRYRLRTWWDYEHDIGACCALFGRNLMEFYLSSHLFVKQYDYTGIQHSKLSNVFVFLFFSNNDNKIPVGSEGFFKIKFRYFNYKKTRIIF